jgi:hypothetical protein
MRACLDLSLTGVAIGNSTESRTNPFTTWKGNLGGHSYTLHIGFELRCQPVNPELVFYEGSTS